MYTSSFLFSFIFWIFVGLADNARHAGEAVGGGDRRGAPGLELRLGGVQRRVHVVLAPLLCIVRPGPPLHAHHVPVRFPVDLRGAHVPAAADACRRHLVLVNLEPGEVAEVVLAQDGLDLGAHVIVAAPLDGVHEVGVGDGVQQAEPLHAHLALGGEERHVLLPRGRRAVHGDDKVLGADRVPKGVAGHFV